METDQLHRGRLIDHLHLIVEDLPKCLEFYQAVLGALNIPMGDMRTTISGPMNCSYHRKTVTPR